MSGVAEVKEVIKIAKNEQSLFKRKTILFVDEIHRFNKMQQVCNNKIYVNSVACEQVKKGTKYERKVERDLQECQNQTFLTEAYVACELTTTNFRANFWKVAFEMLQMSQWCDCMFLVSSNQDVC
jgi:hypothetical protein